jgi:hypothetical protein
MEKSKSKTFALVGTAAGAVLIALVGLSVWATGGSGNDTPRPDADPVTIAKFLTSQRWAKMDEPQKRLYMKTLRQKSDELSDALARGKITKDEHDLAKHNIWLERQLDKMDEYYKLAPGARVKYLDDLVARKIEKRKNPQPKNPNDPDTDDDSPFMEARKEEWPQEMEQRWDNFLDALDAREKARGIH